jgi:hypothetical protein
LRRKLKLEFAEQSLFIWDKTALWRRYPIHFHVAGNHSKSYVKENSVHDTFQRCITLHGVNYVMVSWNVAYNSAGHCFFVEDGNEQQNTLIYNLAIHARPHTLLAHDVR